MHDTKYLCILGACMYQFDVLPTHNIGLVFSAGQHTLWYSWSAGVWLQLWNSMSHVSTYHWCIHATCGVQLIGVIYCNIYNVRWTAGYVMRWNRMKWKGRQLPELNPEHLACASSDRSMTMENHQLSLQSLYVYCTGEGWWLSSCHRAMEPWLHYFT